MGGQFWPEFVQVWATLPIIGSPLANIDHALCKFDRHRAKWGRAGRFCCQFCHLCPGSRRRSSDLVDFGPSLVQIRSIRPNSANPATARLSHYVPSVRPDWLHTRATLAKLVRTQGACEWYAYGARAVPDLSDYHTGAIIQLRTVVVWLCTCYVRRNFFSGIAEAASAASHIRELARKTLS